MSIRFLSPEPTRRARSALLVLLGTVLIPVVLVVGVVFAVFMWPIRKLFPPKPLTATDMVDELDEMLDEQTDSAIDDGLQVITQRDFDDERIEQLKQRVVAIGLPPWTDEAVDELKAIRDSARAIAAGDVL